MSSRSASEGSPRRGSEPKVAGIVGGPAQVASSLSPAIHNAAFQALDLDWIYVSFGMDAGSLLRGIRGLAAGGIRGLNVTLPHKVAALGAVDALSESARRIGALNTIEVRAGTLVGWNTDGEGLVRFLRLDAGAVIEGSRVLVMGSGGSARAAVYSLASAGAGSVTVLARDPRKAAELAPLAAPAPFSTALLGDLENPVVEQADIIINATPIGQGSEQALISASAIGSQTVVVDLVYRPPVTPLIQGARSRGAVAHSGLGMLLHQAALAFEIWTGVPPPMDVMSAAALSELSKSPGPHKSPS